MRKFSILLFIISFSLFSVAQGSYSLYGEVRNKRDKSPIVGAIVSIIDGKKSQQTDENGHFHFNNIETKRCELKVTYLGFETYFQTVELTNNKHLIINLNPESLSLSEVTVTNLSQKESALNTQVVGKSFIFENNSTNLVKTLSKLAGVSSMDIGAGFSKPMIRGLGFNRVAVIDKGITQQDQQWGADHGLELDQYDVDEVIVHKGPMSLQFGSDAIGGAIEIMPTKVPQENIYMSDVTMIGKSNNDLTGISIMNAIKHNNWFVRGRYTLQRYSDYRVPADSLYYLNTRLPIYNKRLKNTAGKEENVSGMIQYANDKFENSLNISNVYQKNGFFPGAHGIPNIDALQHDGSYRNIDMPYNSVNHFKLINNTSVQFTPHLKLVTDLGYQYNHRQELSYFHTHFQNQSPPAKDPNLELDFRLHTYSLNTKLVVEESDKLDYTIGLQTSYQQNKVGGYSFLLPRYDQFIIGGYGLTNYRIDEKLTLLGGLRYDYGYIDIDGFYDKTLAEYLRQQKYDQAEIDRFAQRSYDTKPHFGNISASVGAIYKYNNEQTWKLNIGRSFRLPTANELASNGVHHGAFRHEQGDPNLKAEQGYQMDIDYTINKGIFSLTLSPFISYFSNYIFLEPQGQWSVLPHAGQIYKYREAEALFYGGEYQIHAAIYHHIDLYTSGQYVYNRNETDKYPLPLTPPFSMRNEITYSNKINFVKSYRIGFEHQLYAKQSRISRNEEVTDGSNIFNFSSTGNFQFDQFRFSLGFQVQNIFNTKYMNHLSFYRKIEIPELGRNIQLLLKIPFYN